jgi:endonuclease/exonuclease/phosphatase family metal-dependent hydrolase
MNGISIVTLNTWKGEGDYASRMSAAIGLLAGLDPDIVLLQEVLALPSRGLCTADTLSAALGLNCAFIPAREKMRLFEGGDVLSQSGLAVLARERILSASPVLLPADPRDGERIAQVVHIDGTVPATVLNLHLTICAGRRRFVAGN